MEGIGVLFIILSFVFLVVFFVLCRNVSDIKSILQEKNKAENLQKSKPETDKKA